MSNLWHYNAVDRLWPSGRGSSPGVQRSLAGGGGVPGVEGPVGLGADLPLDRAQGAGPRGGMFPGASSGGGAWAEAEGAGGEGELPGGAFGPQTGEGSAPGGQRQSIPCPHGAFRAGLPGIPGGGGGGAAPGGGAVVGTCAC